ncbi:hypothetical protein [Noviherbaspirillum aerium]|uniref:hypothetical protein n=1 Tax=Noviherbaspirillum aerium TaxID=2588497 RepID=UPI00178C74E7|nr:hypothetical protein [Noviherbaspirillum aerium]
MSKKSEGKGLAAKEEVIKTPIHIQKTNKDSAPTVLVGNSFQIHIELKAPW